MKISNLFKGVISFIISVSMLLSLSLPSFAGDKPNTGTDEGISGSIIQDQLGSIEISKKTTDGKTPIDGVEFSYIKVADMIQESGTVHTIKFKLNEEGKAIFPSLGEPSKDYIVPSKVFDEYVKNEGAGNVAYPTIQKGETVDGKLLFDNLPIGVYLVEETNTDNASIDGNKVKINKGVRPFLVSVPQTSPDGTKWVYDVKINVKNVIDDETVKKTVEGDYVVFTDDKYGSKVATAGIGTTMWYTVTGSASKVIEESIYTQYEVEDMITPALKYGAKGDSQATFIDKVEVYLEDTVNKLDAADYNIIFKIDSFTNEIAGFNLALTSTGLDKLNDKVLMDATSVFIKYPVNLTEEILDFEAINTAKIMYTHKGGNPSSTETNLEVFSLALEIEKLFDNISVTNLPAGNKIDPTKVKFTIDKKDEPNIPIYVKETNSYEFGAVYIADLSVTQEGNGFKRLFNIFDNGSAIVLGLPKGTYVITEVETVDGYSLLKEAIELTIDKDQRITTKMIPVEDEFDAMLANSIRVSNFSEIIINENDTFGTNDFNIAADEFEVAPSAGEYSKETGDLYREFFVNARAKTVTNSNFEVIIEDKVQTFKPDTFKIEKGKIEKVGTKVVLTNPVEVTADFKRKTTLNSNGFKVKFDSITPTDQYKISYTASTDFGPSGPPITGRLYDMHKWVGTGVVFSANTNIRFSYLEKLFGTVKLIMVDAENPAMTLTGAEFELYTSEDSNPIKRVTTNSSGEILMNELQYGYYYLKEITPPTGYVLNPARIDFAILEDNYQELQILTVANTKDNILEPIYIERPFEEISKLTINNDKAPAFELPSTGGAGAFVYTLTGILLTSAAVLLFIVTNKNNRRM